MIYLYWRTKWYFKALCDLRFFIYKTLTTKVWFNIFLLNLLAKFMGDDKPPAYPPYPGYPPPGQMPAQNVAVAPAAPAVGTGGAKSFFPIYDSNRFFRV